MKEPAKESWGVGGAYESYVGRWSRLVAAELLAWLALPPGQVWGDVGCGTGVLTGQILASARPAAVHAIDRSYGFLAAARGSLQDPRARFSAADAAALPWASRACDVTVSGLVLNFVPHPADMAAEMARVTRPGGRVAAYVWDYAAGMAMIRHFWDAAIEVDPRAAALDQADRFPVCHPEPLKQLFQAAGLTNLVVRAIEIPTVFRDFADYWTPFLGGQGSAPTYLAALDPARREQIREILRAHLAPAPDGTIRLTARAWAVRGVVPQTLSSSTNVIQ